MPDGAGQTAEPAPASVTPLEPGLAPAAQRLYVLIATAVVLVNLLYFDHRRPPRPPAELTDGYVPPPGDRIQPPWGYESDADLADPRVLDQLDEQLEQRRGSKRSRLEEWRASASIASGDFDEAETKARIAVHLDPTNLEARETLLAALLLQSKLEEARAEAARYLAAGGEAARLDPRLRPAAK